MSDDRVYIAISRPEGYEDVHPDIVIDDWVREAGWNEWEHVTDEIERLRRLRDECRTVLRGDDDSMPADIHPADAARRRMDELASLRAEVAALTSQTIGLKESLDAERAYMQDISEVCKRKQEEVVALRVGLERIAAGGDDEWRTFSGDKCAEIAQQTLDAARGAKD